MLKKSYNTLIVVNILLIIAYISSFTTATNPNTKRNNGGGSKKINSNNKAMNVFDVENNKEMNDDETDQYVYSYSKPRSVSMTQFNSDSCHLNIECKDNKNTHLRLPIYGPKGDPGPPGMTGMKGEKGEPGVAGIPARDPPPPNFSAFFAALQNNTGPFKQDKDLVFTQVLTNYGENYDSNTGVYTAPFNGIYQFLVTISATGRQKAGVNVMKNRQSILTVWSESEPWSTSSQTIIVRLAVNDKVYLRLLSRASHVHGYMYSSFGGSLLYEELNLV